MFRPGESGVPPVRPIVYHPYAETDPASYERYTDPAAAHGWENAYDETAELPRVRPAEPASRPEPGGRAGRRRAAHRTGGRPSRRVLVAAGAVGAVALAAVAAGMSFSGDPAGDQRGRQGDTRSASDGAVSPSDGPASAGSGSAGPLEPTPSASAAPVSPSGGAASEAPSAGSSAGAAASGAATAAAPAPASGSPKGNPGKGRGRGKGGR
ncbi:hypothetical protein [Streptomyces sp. AK04-3B]|uniref:hypothetical protein n=1 Tax=Streptomyces sp. AK04-3B TaxID=3028650 RepID=UPI0029BF40C6|nr:hypothetical protein [Streptomyces sp. AK04-3B]MDX3798214.1 hypothetical protein [Streptomyces sp. AK04-3B]